MSSWTSRAGRTIPSILQAQAEKRPDQTFLVLGGEAVTYAQARERTESAAASLEALGIAAQDRVGIFMAACPEWIWTWFGAAWLGAVTVPVNTAFRGDFLAGQLESSRVSLLVTDDDLADRVPGGIPQWRRADAGAASTAGLTTEPRAVWNQPGSIFYTSGTTGRSKGVVTTQHYLLAAAEAAVRCWELQEGETVYAPLPLFHLSAIGSVLGPLLAGGTGVIEKVFSVSRTWEEVRRHGAAGILLAGPMLAMLWNLPPDPSDADLPIRFLSAAPVPKDTYRQIEQRYGCSIVTMYGLSESFPITYAGVSDDNPPGASGKPNPVFDVAIFDEDDRAVGPGEVGEIVCRPREPHVMFDDYDGHPDARVEQTSNLWFHTGDLGRLDDAGNLYYVDRKKDAMRRRGENISSFEVEQAVLGHPRVAEVAAIGIASDLGEDDVMVCLTLHGETDLDVIEFMDFCTERMPYFAVPRYVQILSELPKNAMGRVMKPVLRDRGVGPGTWDREKAGYTLKR